MHLNWPADAESIGAIDGDERMLTVGSGPFVLVTFAWKYNSARDVVAHRVTHRFSSGLARQQFRDYIAPFCTVESERDE